MVLLLLGCATVTLEPSPGPFPVLGAFSFPSWKSTGFALGDGKVERFDAATGHSATLSDVSFTCMRAQSVQQAWNEASADLLDASKDGEDFAAFCAGMPAFLERKHQADRTEPSTFQHLRFEFCIEDDAGTCGGTVPAGDFQMDGSDPNLDTEFLWDRATEQLDPVEYWDSEQCLFDWDKFEEDEAALEVESYEMDGTLTIDPGDGQILAGSWDATLVMDGGTLDGASMSGAFSTTRCDVPQGKKLVTY